MKLPKLTHRSVIGYCSTKSGEKGCTGYRRVTEAAPDIWLCDHHFPHRARLVKQIQRERAR